jgi:putative oxidoreductase
MFNPVNLLAEDIAKLLLRLAVGGLMLFHGIQKIFHGVDAIAGMLNERGLPPYIAYGAYVGEVVAPVLILAGVLTRLSSLVVAGTMVMAVYLALSDKVLKLNDFGGWALELNALYFLGALALALLGPGRFSLWQARNRFMR